MIITLDRSDDVQLAVDPRRYRLGLTIWLLLFLNGLSSFDVPSLIPVPVKLMRLGAEGAIVLATFLVLGFNRRKLVRPNLFLTLYGLLAALGVISSLRMNSGIGSVLRSGRFCVLILLLWLLTPLWGRRDRILLGWHMTLLAALVGSVILGLLISPGGSRTPDGRLFGHLWPIPPPQVGHYSAVLAGIVFVLAIAGAMSRRVALPVGIVSVLVLLLSHTRTALIGLIAGLAAAVLSLIFVRKWARRTAMAAGVAAVLAALVFAPALGRWYSRGDSSGNLNGRTTVWEEVFNAPRDEVGVLIGRGLTNASFNGRSIDGSWPALYADEGLIGVAIGVAVVLSLLMLATTKPSGPDRAVALFLIVYCLVAAISETGLGAASVYLLDLTVAASLLAA